MAQIGTKRITEQYGVSRRTVRRMIEAGELKPTSKLSLNTGAYVFDEVQVAAAFQARTERKTAVAA